MMTRDSSLLVNFIDNLRIRAVMMMVSMMKMMTMGAGGVHSAAGGRALKPKPGLKKLKQQRQLKLKLKWQKN